MIAIFGLGNPGKNYKGTWHNVGFLVMDDFLKNNDFPVWQESKKNNCLYSKKEINGKEIELIKPLRFINNSGVVVKTVSKKHNLKPENIFVVHDDIDLMQGKIKIAKNRGAAGHKGVASIIEALGTKNFIRFRLGIRPAEIEKVRDLKSFVLRKLNKKDREALRGIIKKASEAIRLSISESPEKAMQEFN